MGWEDVAIDIAESNKEGFHTFKLDFIPVPAMSIADAYLPNRRIQASRVEEQGDKTYQPLHNHRRHLNTPHPPEIT